MHIIRLSVLAVLTGFAVAAVPAQIGRNKPTKTLNRRSVTGCSQYASNTETPYVIQNNLWGEGSGTGSQCYTANPVSGETISWSTEWQWSGNPYNVKSYANVLLTVSDTQLSQVSSIPTSWQWSYSNYDVIADVSYDLFTANTPSGTVENHQYEIMVWLASLGGANPISTSYPDSYANPIASYVDIDGYQFNLTSGPGGNGATVYSFLPSVRSDYITDFNGNIMDFINYLIKHEGLPNTQYLLSVQAGTEAFSGSGTMTSEYSVQVNE